MFVPFQLDSDLQHSQRSSTDRCLAAYVRNAFAAMDAPVTYQIGICSLCTPAVYLQHLLCARSTTKLILHFL